MGAIIGLLLPFLPTLISLVERVIPGPSQGATKASTVNAWVSTIAQDLQKSGVFAGGAIDPKQLEAVVETVFQQMNGAGQVNQTVGTPAKGGDFILTFKSGLMQSVG